MSFSQLFSPSLSTFPDFLSNHLPLSSHRAGLASPASLLLSYESPSTLEQGVLRLLKNNTMNFLVQGHISLKISNSFEKEKSGYLCAEWKQLLASYQNFSEFSTDLIIYKWENNL